LNLTQWDPPGEEGKVKKDKKKDSGGGDNDLPEGWTSIFFS
jgi:hypothetical protein